MNGSRYDPPDVRPIPGESLESWSYRCMREELRQMREAFASMLGGIREAAARDAAFERRMREADLARPRRSEAQMRGRVTNGAQDRSPFGP